MESLPSSSYTVLLYYAFLHIPEWEAKGLWQSQKELTTQLGLKGRILIGEEGINGTVAGDLESIQAYKQACWGHELLKDIVFKESSAHSVPFPKMKVKYRKEIITLQQDAVRQQDAAPYITPDQLHALYQSGQEFYIIDTRNDYEWQEGTFVDALTPAIANFRELPQVVQDYTDLKEKKVVTVCTGGIRCEKASALFRQYGFTDVYQLEGGIVSYIQQYPNQYYQGDCHVFDDRMRLTQAEIAQHGRLSLPPH
jgi:UPF0176 protein